jgi:uncharacterized protein YcbX
MSATALLCHYVDFLFSPTTLLTLVVLVVPLLLSVRFEQLTTKRNTRSFRIPGCLRMGLRSKSNISDQYQPQQAGEKATPRIKALFTYPIKSCRGVELSASQVDSSGLLYDRLFTFAQLVSKPVVKEADATVEPSGEWNHQWRFITEREFPRLVLLETELWLPDPRRKPPATAHKGANGHNSKKLKTAEPQPRQRSRTRGNTLMGELEREGRRLSTTPEVSDWTANGGCLVLRFPYEPDYNFFGLCTETVTLQIPLVPTPQRAEAKGYSHEDLSIWKDVTQAINVTSEIDEQALAKLKYFLGISNPLALFRLDEKHKRAITRSLPKDQPRKEYKVGLADAFPVNLLGLASVRAVDDELPAAADAKGKLDIRRFRANIIISGAPAFEEDKWKKIALGRRIGRDHEGLFETDGEYHVACRTARCKLPNVDPDTGVKDRNEPSSTLTKTRQVDEGAYPHSCLGMQMIPLFQRGMLRVGDEVEVLETGEHVYEKMFP